MKKIFLLILLLALAIPTVVLAQANNNTNYETILANVRTTVQNIAATIVVIGWIIAGILFLMARGEPEKLNTAKRAFIYAVIGTAVIIIGWTSTRVISLIKDALGIT